MAYSWRPPPPQQPPLQGDRCPVCSYSHFPFCPPPPLYPPNPRLQYQPHPGQFYHGHPPPVPPQPAYDPFVDHHTGPPQVPPHRPYVDGYQGLRSPWNQGANFNNDPYGNSNSTANFSHGNGGAKRMRTDDPSSVMNESCAKSARFSVDDERRLQLIRDHGVPAGQEISSRGDHGNSEGYGNGANNFHDSGCGDLDRKQGYYELQASSEKVDKNSLQSNGYGFSSFPANNYNNVDQGRNTIQHEQSGGLGFGSENHNFDSSYSDFYPEQHSLELKQNQYGSALTRQGASNPRGMTIGLGQGSRAFPGQPPLPAGTPGRPFLEPVVSSSPSGTTSSLFPIHNGTSASMPSYPPATEAAQAYYHANGNSKSPSGFPMEELRTFHYASSRTCSRESEQYPARHPSSEKPKIFDASHILKHPHRSARPDHIVVILRGLPGSGKSYLAKMLRDLEVENGGNAPRIHSIDDYFMTEVEKVDESEVSKSVGSTKGKKTVKMVIEYCYEPEMEEAYRSSMLKAFKKTLDEGAFSFVIVDDRNLRVADFAQFWATAKRSGYEVYLLEAPYKDPAGCAARNVHGFTLDEIRKLTCQWEEAPSLYLKLDVKSLIHGDDLEHGGIEEVDMDMEDGDSAAEPSTSEQGNTVNAVLPATDITSDDNSKGDLSWDDEAEHHIDSVKDLGKSKWSTDLDEDDIQKDENTKRKPNALSGLIQSYRKEGKTVRWGDQAVKAGFSIGATKAANVSLIIGPGEGYNLKSNPLREEEKTTLVNGSQTKRQGVFQEQLRAEHESFKAVFDKRRQRIGGLDAEEE
ncbi:PREDICTED: uncharacterized protein LOC109149473 isoform X1 [Ipomoea nil]|uniref:uncharacterized protein LOC109149473 isoform X1 n=1 Tax=Ipomoea nil TaxID=35883 RepID=UPI000901B87E|nr:PREDICTED: uncharacterized protein LOC109149473 isoform X1 [Ipomoea nil]